jgi:hypothetical protein
LGAGDADAEMRDEEDTWDLQQPRPALGGDGFPVQPLLSYDMLGHRIRPFLVLDLFRLLWRTTMSTSVKAIIPIFLGLFIVPAQAQWLGPTWETNIV